MQLRRTGSTGPPPDAAATVTTGRAVVVGGSIAGLLTARVLSDHAAQVVVLERESLPVDATARGHVPQGRHLHALLAAGLRLLEEWFPGIRPELVAEGAVTVDGSGGWVWQSGGYRARGDWGGSTLSLTRPLLEHVVRRRVAALPNVTVVEGVRADAVTLDGDRVTGVRSGDRTWAADLVADCSGRSSRLLHRLAADGVLVPPTTEVGIDVAYASRLLRRSPDDFSGQFAVIASAPADGLRVGAAMPVEGDRWQITVAGMHGDAPPADDEGFAAFAESLPSPVVGQILRRCEPVSEVAVFRYPASRRRHFERLDRMPAGLVVVGDAACSFDPVYGQGMSSSALQAEALGRTLIGHGGGAGAMTDGRLPMSFHRTAARIIDVPWTIAVGGDFAHPATVGERPRGSAVVNLYVDRVMRATHSSLLVARRLNRVLNLDAPALSLASPVTLARVLAATRPGAARGGVVHPRVGPAA